MNRIISLLTILILLFSACEEKRELPWPEAIKDLRVSWYHLPNTDEGPSFRFRFETDRLDFKYEITYVVSVVDDVISIVLDKQKDPVRCQDYPGDYPRICFTWDEVFLPESLLDYGDYSMIIKGPKFSAEGRFIYREGEAIIEMSSEEPLILRNDYACIQPKETIRGHFRYRGEFNDSIFNRMLTEFEAIGLVQTTPDSVYNKCETIASELVDTLYYYESPSVYGTGYSREILYYYPSSIPFQEIIDIAEIQYQALNKYKIYSSQDWYIGLVSGFGDYISLSDRQLPQIEIANR